MLKRQIEISLRDIIEYIVDTYNTKGESEVYEDNNWCIYSEDFDVTLDSKCVVDNYPDYDDDDNEILPEYAEQNDMELVFRDELIQDVIINAVVQKKDLSVEKIMEAINYYNEYDCFMEI